MFKKYIFIGRFFGLIFIPTENSSWAQSLVLQIDNAPPATTTVSGEIDLLQAMRLAEQHSYTHKAAVAQWQGLELNKSAATRSFAPQIIVGGNSEWQHNISDVNGATTNITDPTGNSATDGWTSLADAELRQPLTGLITTYNAYQQATHQAQAARYQGLSQKDQAALLGAQNYLNYLLAQENVLIQKANLDAAEKSRDDAKAMYETGSIYRDDYLQFVLQYTQAKQLLTTAQSQVLVTNFILAQTLGLPTTQSLPIARHEVSLWEQWIPTLIPLEVALNKVTNQNPSLQASRSTVLASQANRAVVRNNFLPQIDAFALYRWDWSRDVGDEGTSRVNDIIGGITLEWTLWDWGVRSAELGAATEQVYQSQYEELQNIETIKNNVVTQYHAINDALATVQAAKEAVDVAKEAYELVNFRFSLGQVSALDVTTALKNFTQAQGVLAQSRFDLDLAWVTFLVYLGERPQKAG